MRYIINDVRIFDGTGSALTTGSVVVRNERIESVIAAGENPASAPGDMIINGRGATLMPGLVEAHAHLTWPSSVEKMYHEFVLPPDEMKVATWRNARVLLDHGFTSAYSAGALGETHRMRAQGRYRGRQDGGPALARLDHRAQSRKRQHGGRNVEHGRGPQAMRNFVAHCKAIGVDSVKLLISGEDALLPGSSQHILYEEDELAAADEARPAARSVAQRAYAGCRRDQAGVAARRACALSLQLGRRRGARPAGTASRSHLRGAGDRHHRRDARGAAASAYRHGPDEGERQAGHRARAQTRARAQAARRPRAAGWRLRISVQSKRPQCPRPRAFRELCSDTRRRKRCAPRRSWVARSWAWNPSSA